LNRNEIRASNQKTGGDLSGKPALFIDVFQRGFFGFVDGEYFAKLHQIKHLFDVFVDVTHPQRNFGGFAFLAEQYQLADHRGGHKTHVLKIQNDFAVIRIVDQIRQLLPEAIDSGLINDPNILKIRQQNAVF
jgi:hypothetical protein